MSKSKWNEMSFRPGRKKTGGRKAGVPNKATTKCGATIADLARTVTPEAFNKLIALMRRSKNEIVQLRAAEAILDRGVGKAPLFIGAGATQPGVYPTPEEVKAELDRRGITLEIMNMASRLIEYADDKATTIDARPVNGG
jgi:hypothetical protein